MEWFGLGKKRSRLGKWLDQHGIAQLEVEKRSGLSRGTISKACSDDDYSPTLASAKKIIKAIRDLTKKNVDYDDFWQM